MLTRTLVLLGTSLMCCLAWADLQLTQLIPQVEGSTVFIVCQSATGPVSGTGFVVGHNMVATNHHVVNGCTSITVMFKDGAVSSCAGVLHLDEGRDIAVLATPLPQGKVPLAIGNQIPPKGTDVAAFGMPQGLLFSVSKGIVSNSFPGTFLTQRYQKQYDGNWIQTDAAISQGNSGGPLVAFSGEVVGMNTLIDTPNRSQNLNFAVSCLDLKAAISAATVSNLVPLAQAFPVTAPAGTSSVQVSELSRIELNRLVEEALEDEKIRRLVVTRNSMVRRQANAGATPMEAVAAANEEVIEHLVLLLASTFPEGHCVDIAVGVLTGGKRSGYDQATTVQDSKLRQAAESARVNAVKAGMWNQSTAGLRRRW